VASEERHDQDRREDPREPAFLHGRKRRSPEDTKLSPGGDILRPAVRLMRRCLL
jgi:hypothetical protein